MAKKRLTKDDLERAKNHAKLLYTRDGVTLQKELAQRTGISENTISKWVNENGWDKLKKNFLLTREERMGDLLDELTELQKSIKDKPEGSRFADSKTGDVRRKLIKDIKELEVTAAKPEIIAACMALINFARTENLEEAKIIMRWADIFIKSLLQ
ncbi:putative DNA-binding transcriptional regulator [Pedobacter sp. PAMC26386]|nr:putative DNA-binding transcriptional regulator [Pedobacter sp. PAMC26386]